MTDFAVSHIFVAGKTDGSAVSLELAIDRVGLEPVEMGGESRVDCIAFSVLPDAYAIHDNEHDRALGAKIRCLFQ
jgi:hypothetical protein